MDQLVPARQPFFTQDAVAEVLPELDDNTCAGQVKLRASVVAIVLNEIAVQGTMIRACQRVGVSMGNFSMQCSRKPALKKLVREAKAIYGERLAEAIHKRGVEGWEEPVFYQGVEVGTIRKYSDRMLEIQAKRHVPEYRDKAQVDVNVSGGVLVAAASVAVPPKDPKEAEQKWLDAYDAPSS